MTKPSEPYADGALAMVDNMFREGTLPANAYYKCLMTIASQYLVNEDDLNQSLVVLNRCPPEYFLETLRGQMEEDQIFAVCMLELVHKLYKFGILMEDLYKPTQGGADA